MAGAAVVLYPAALQAMLNGPGGLVAKDLARRAIRVESAAKRLAPADTGRPRASLTRAPYLDGGGLHARIGTNVLYAIFQELGTRYMAAHPFLVPALRAAA